MKETAAKKDRTISPKKAPKQERSRAMVEKLLSAARSVLLEEGAEGLTTNNIAKRAGISVGSLYQYSPNKQSIIAELFRQWLAENSALEEIALYHPTELESIVALHRQQAQNLLSGLLDERA
ncbi:MAG: helix-turn-helix domain-containing protein [Halioglobus sp.]